MSKIFTDESGRRYELSEYSGSIGFKDGELLIKPVDILYNFSLEWREIGSTHKDITDDAATMHVSTYTIEEAKAIQKALGAVMTYINSETGSEREVEWKEAAEDAMALVHNRRQVARKP